MSIIDDFIDSRLQRAEHPEPVGFMESFGDSFDVAIGEDLSISKFLNRDLYADRNQYLSVLREKGDIPPQVWQAHSRDAPRGMAPIVDWDGLSVWAQRNLNADTPTDKELQENIRGNLKIRREAMQRKLSAGGTGETAGALTGALAAGVMDPVNLLVTPLGVPVRTAQSMSATARIMQAAKIGAVENLAAEALIQPLIYDYKYEIESPYTVGDAMAGMAAAAGLGATVNGVATGLAALIRGSRGMPALSIEREVMEDALREFAQSPQMDAHPSEHLGRMGEIESELNEGRPAYRGEIHDPVELEEDAQIDEMFNAVRERSAVIEETEVGEAGQLHARARPAGEMVDELDDLDQRLQAAKDCYLAAA